MQKSMRSTSSFLAKRRSFIDKKRKETLEQISRVEVFKSRQHYIRFNLPEGYRRLIEAGLSDDYSMGYATSNGFRASVASSHFWYNLEKQEQTTLRIHPLVTCG